MDVSGPYFFCPRNSRGLNRGRFLLLIIGGRIRRDLRQLSSVSSRRTENFSAAHLGDQLMISVSSPSLAHTREGMTKVKMRENRPRSTFQVV